MVEDEALDDVRNGRVTEYGSAECVCAENCPAGAISLDNIRKVDKKKCISCMRCVADCPNNARGIGSIINFLISMAIKKPCASRKENELFM